MPGWQDRVNIVCRMTSPQGDVYNPKWIGNDRSFSKKIGEFTYPKKPGTITQDLSVAGWKYPITVFFDGADHDKDAENFANSLLQDGRWQVQHPTKGGLELQLLTVAESIQPVTAGNQTVFTLDFLEPADAAIIESIQLLKSIVKTNNDKLRLELLQQFADKVSGLSAKAQTAIKNVVNKITSAADLVLGPIAQITSAVNSTFNAIQRGINDTLNATVLDTLALAGQVNALTEVPGQAVTSFQNKVSSYGDMVTELFNLDTDDVDDAGFVTFATKELASMSVMIAVTNLVTDAEFQTQADAINAINDITALSNSITVNLDNDQEKFNDSFIEDQYVSFAQTYSTFVNSIYSANNYLLKSSFDLAVEKKIILKKPRNPIDIVVTEYKDIDKLDFFIETNKLKGNDIMLLPAGREVVLYLNRT